MPLLNTANKIYVGTTQVTKIYLGTTLVWPCSLDYSQSHNSGYFLLLMV